VLGWLAPQVVGARLDILEHQRVDVGRVSPLQPVTVGNLEMHVHHAVDQRRGHRAHDGAVFGAVAGPDDDRALRQAELAQAPVLDQAVKGFLHVVRAGIQLVQKETVGIGARDQAGRAEMADPVHDLRHADQVLWGELRAQERDARQADLVGEGAHDG
jgi:hypothetical protein